MIHAIGNTPLIQLKHLPGPDDAEVWVKWEGANPTGSMKDRMALAMVMGAESIGLLEPGGTVVDYTGGSTGSSLAMVCAARGYKAHFVSSDAFAESKLRTMRAFGATVEIIPCEGGKITAELIAKCIDRVQELTDEPGYFFTDQFNNNDNRRAYRIMGKEILGGLQGRLDAFVAGVGTGGCFSGNAEYLKEHLPLVQCYAVEPMASQVIAGEEPKGGHRLEGMGAGFVPGIFRDDLCDGTVPVSDEDAMETTRQLAKKEGLFGGTSSGANVWAALQKAKELGHGHRVATVVCDSGLKYLDGDLYQSES
ncbi:MAG: cysteine synthase family protein [Armatimonadetes bacterium]|nr:cysteine synthase family protein [Armatimonadota bacterium]